MVNLQKRLIEAGVTQREVAEKADVSHAAVSLTIRGKSKSARIVEIAEQLIKEKKDEQKETQ